MQPFRPPPGQGVLPFTPIRGTSSVGVPVGVPVAVNPAMMAMRGPPPRGPPPPVMAMAPPPMANMVIPGTLGPRGPVPPPPGMMMHRMAALPETGPLNVFVGKLPTDLNDSYVRNLLEKCGHVVSWKRTADPVTNKPKAFGYCTYSNALDVMRALRLLNGFSMDSKQILVKVDTKTQAKLDEFTAAMTEPMKAAEQARDEELRRVLKRLEDERSGLKGGIQNHPESWGDLLGVKSAENGDGDNVENGKADGEASDSAAEAAPVETKVQQKMILTEIEKFRLAQEQREREQEQKRRDALRERLRREEMDEKLTKEQEPLVEETPQLADRSVKAQAPVVPGHQEPISVRTHSAADEEMTSHRAVENGTDQEIKERSRTRDRERKKERDRRDRDRDRSRDRSRDRDRRKRARSKSRSRSRSHSRERSHRRRRRSSRTHSRSRSRSRSRERDRDRDRRRRRRHSSAADDELKSGERRSKRRRDSRGDDKDADDVIERKPAESARAPPVKVVMELKMPLIAPKKEKPAPQPTASLFQLEEIAEEKPVRELIRIDFDAEEKQEKALAQERAAAAATKISSRTEDVKTLINRIPTDSAGLFAYPIDWDGVDKHCVVQIKMEPWVKKKVLEYVGEEDKTMIQFILSKLSAHAKPNVILDELHVILEDEAEVFVKLLWRKLAFEALRAGAP